jgi:hypothetical protein
MFKHGFLSLFFSQKRKISLPAHYQSDITAKKIPALVMRENDKSVCVFGNISL